MCTRRKNGVLELKKVRKPRKDAIPLPKKKKEDIALQEDSDEEQVKVKRKRRRINVLSSDDESVEPAKKCN